MEKQRFGVIGFPIKHSLSPAMHNAVFRKLKLNCEYSKIEVKPENLGNAIVELRGNGFKGLNVTIPHKVSVVGYLDRLSRGAELTGAVNTIKFGKESCGFNTDGIGCIRALEEVGVGVKGKRMLMLGAGGAARAIGFRAVLEGAKLAISNIEKGMVVSLVDDIKSKLGVDVEVIDFDVSTIEEKLKDVDVIINATPVGMFPKVDESVIPAGIIPKNVMVMDVVYNPKETKLLRECRKKGIKTVDGVGMFVHQGAEALKIWLGIKAPVGLMRRVVEKELK